MVKHTDDTKGTQMIHVWQGRNLLFIGVGLVVLGLLMPRFLTVESVGLYDTLEQAIYQYQEIYVLFAALKLVCLNTIRAFPQYLGVFLIVESFAKQPRYQRTLLTALALGGIIPSVYFLIERIYGISYDLGIPAISMLAAVTVLSKIDFSFVNIVKKMLMVAFLIGSLQFLDMMPNLWVFHFGRGESSVDVKQTALFLDAVDYLQIMSTFFFVLFLLMAVLLLILINDENQIQKINELKEQKERMLVAAQVAALENRTYRELQHLVHDLKSPLTSMQALVSVLRLTNKENDGNMKEEYLMRVENHIDRMSNMISEILHEDQRLAITTAELMDGIMAQISISDYAELVNSENNAPEKKVLVNKVRMIRAVVNLIENAFCAVDREHGQIDVRMDMVRRAGKETVALLVRDNGMGIAEEDLDSIWENGFSRHSSSGFGMAFVKKVVDQSEGEIELTSTEGKGTRVTIFLPCCRDEKSV